jgi:hypothetical protein
MFVILHRLGMFVADMFKARRRLEAENLFLRHQLNIALRPAPPRDGRAQRHWFAHRDIADYNVILDAVTDAYISKQTILLFGGTIERFRFAD